MYEMIKTIADEAFLEDDKRSFVDFLEDVINTIDSAENTLYQPFILSLQILKEAMED